MRNGGLILRNSLSFIFFFGAFFVCLIFICLGKKRCCLNTQKHFIWYLYDMGIQGLLPNLASITKTVHLRDFANLRVGVDAYVWLHKATYCCSYELCNNIPTDK